MNIDDMSYYRMRWRQEEAAARNAACCEARDRHEEMAAAYRLRCRLVPVVRACDEAEAETPVAPSRMVEPA